MAIDSSDTPWPVLASALGCRLTAFQCRMLLALQRGPRVAVKTGHGIGKGYAASVAILLFELANVEEGALTVVTAPTGRQAGAIIWSELMSRTRELCEGRTSPGLPRSPDLEINEHVLKIGGRRAAMHYTAPPAQATAFQGIHAPCILVVVDEAAGVDRRIFEAASTLGTGAGSKQLVLGNPTNPGEFERMFERGSGWEALSCSCFEHPNVRLDRNVVPGAVSREWIDSRWARHGDRSGPVQWPPGELPRDLRRWPDWARLSAHDDPFWQGRVLSVFPTEGPDTLVTAAVFRAVASLSFPADSGRRTTLGVDIARFGRDLTVLCACRGRDVVHMEDHARTSGPQVVRLVVAAARRLGVDPRDVRIDATGIGGMGVGDWLPGAPGLTEAERELWAQCEAVEFGGRAREPDRFVDRRAEILYGLRQRFEDRSMGLGSLDARWTDVLDGELRGLSYGYRGSRIAIEAKEQYRKRTGHSPDHAEALALAAEPSRLGSTAAADVRPDELLADAGIGVVGCRPSRGGWRTDDEDLLEEEAERRLSEAGWG
jgi:hypothetical protein